METLRFKADSATRRRFFVPDSFAHPAKMASGLVLECIERYSQPGDLVLDPMAGVGTTLLAALMGRNVICVELEQHFVEPMRRSWEKMRTMPMLGHEMGQAVILQGDARCLPLPDASVEAAITSPPYEETLAHGGGGANAEKGLSDGYTRPVDAIVTSPPFEDKVAMADTSWLLRHTDDPAMGKFKQKTRHYHENLATSYTRPVDAIVTSPPYEGVADASKNTNTNDALRGHPETQGKPMAYGRGENIGNMKGDTYWEAMRLCYAECWRVLRPGGLLCLVLKGFTRASEYVDLPAQTEALLLEAGWMQHDHWRRELWSLSFWRILQKRRDPAAFDERLKFEEVLAFAKGRHEVMIKPVSASSR